MEQKIWVSWKAYKLAFKTITDAERFCREHKNENPYIITESKSRNKNKESA